MFNKNENIKVGRDFNVYIDKSIENLNDAKLRQKKIDSNFILKKESRKRLKKTINLFIFAIVFFLILYFGLPFMLNRYGNEENIVVNFLTEITKDEKITLLLSGLALIMSILNPLHDLWKSNDIERRQYEILKSINTILKEREYLKK